MKRQYITAREISEIMGTSQGQAYKFIRQMNQELKEQGFLWCGIKKVDSLFSRIS